MPTRKRRESRDSAHSGPFSSPPDQSMCKWEKIGASTAKCDVCGKRNTKGNMVRCEHCRWQTCHSTCPTDPKCMHRRDGRRCAHQCDHDPQDDVAPDKGTRTTRLTAANAGSARPRPRRSSVRGRARANTNERTGSRRAPVRREARANAGASSASLHSEQGSGSSVRTASARRPRVSRNIIASTLSARSPSASGSGDCRARISPHIIPSRTVVSINASSWEDSPLSQTDLIAAHSGPNSSSLSGGEDDTSSSESDIPYSINQADRNTARTASRPSSTFSDSPLARSTSPSSPCTVANENDNASCCEETPQINDTSLNKEDLDGAERLLALRILVDIEFEMTRCGKCGSYNAQSPRACAFALATELRQGWERVNLPQRKTPAHRECRSADDNSDNGDNEDDDREDDIPDDSDSDYVDP
ncbi:hypothetical protein BDV10DRAFT_158908 [Aspergillus recurvatus]